MQHAKSASSLQTTGRIRGSEQQDLHQSSTAASAFAPSLLCIKKRLSKFPLKLRVSILLFSLPTLHQGHSKHTNNWWANGGLVVEGHGAAFTILIHKGLKPNTITTTTRTMRASSGLYTFHHDSQLIALPLQLVDEGHRAALMPLIYNGLQPS
eukprot:1161539-Pelagomonas_calceolata.AAC.13